MYVSGKKKVCVFSLLYVWFDKMILWIKALVHSPINVSIQAKFPGKSLYALGRSWFKEGVTKEDKCHRSDDDELKGYLKEFVEQARAAKVLARMSRYAHRCGKKKFVPKMLSLDDLLMALDQEG
ncbi:hypothetical protein HanHA300_Chr04g0147771 [Helianthus annuus]|nr:hypothetical protein HanHA300_Chr04g0147771 [Helianthus annuus]KAJ0598014.1 hypothetical protein HanHA89_Chr04g0161131 [Helianthus annuus]KAJ0758644.1 hypothetical protein HanLR1_Chr04g0152711 [Helianthus annuus]KAJ0762315.1 hypothetical protein HanOQP8_Chr04g0160001 [Helianthus annuus]